MIVKVEVYAQRSIKWCQNKTIFILEIEGQINEGEESHHNHFKRSIIT